MSNLESEGRNLPACKFLSWSEVRVDEMPFWRFEWFLWYQQKIIKFLRSDSWSTIKITPRNEFWSTNYPVFDHFCNFVIFKKSKWQNLKKKCHFLWVIWNQRVKNYLHANFEPDPKSGSLKWHFGVSGDFLDIFQK